MYVEAVYKFTNFTTWGMWRLEKNIRDSAPEFVASALMRSLSHVSHRSGHDFLSPIATDMVMSGLQIGALHTHYVEAIWSYVVAAWVVRSKIATVR